MVDLSLLQKRAAAKLRTATSPRITQLECARAVLAAGWTGGDAVTAVAVVGAESGYRVKARNVDAQSGSQDDGLFQVNQIWKPTVAEQEQVLPNAKKGFQIWKETRGYDKAHDGFNAWVAYRVFHRHEQFMEGAGIAVAQAYAELLAVK